MYIAPNSYVKLFKDVPLNSTYEGTLWFSSLQEQEQYFAGPKLKFFLTENSYQRYEDEYIIVEEPIADLLDVTYMAFKNNDYENKWFYAFVTNVEYVSNGVSKLYYTLDIMQTWMFNWNFGDCFIEREHVIDDTIGLHTIPEMFEVGELKRQSTATPLTDSNRYLVITSYAYIFVQDIDNVSPGVYTSSVFGIDTESMPPVIIDNKSAVHQIYNVFPFTTDVDIMKAYNIISYLSRDADVNDFERNFPEMCVVPSAFIGTIRTKAGKSGYTCRHCTGYGEYLASIRLNLPYRPKNNKALTSQYLKFKLSTVNGQSTDFSVNDYQSGTFALRQDNQGYYLSFNNRISGGVFGQVGYRIGVVSDINENPPCLNEVTDTGSIPSAPLTGQNFVGAMLNLAVTGLKTVVGTVMKTPAMSSTYSTQDLSNFTADKVRTTPKGTQTIENPNMTSRQSSTYSHSIGRTEFSKPLEPMFDRIATPFSGSTPKSTSRESGMLDQLYNVPIVQYSLYTAESSELMAVDNYLNVFGYAVNRIGVPNTQTGRCWNYVKTKWCTLVNTSCPDSFVDQIKSIFNNGIILWHSDVYANAYTNPDGTPIDNR